MSDVAILVVGFKIDGKYETSRREGRVGAASKLGGS